MPAKTPVHAYAQECGRFHQCLELMEWVLDSTAREIVNLRRRHSSIRRPEGITPRAESLARLVHHNLGQCQDYMTDAVAAARQIDQMLVDDVATEETSDAGSVGP